MGDDLSNRGLQQELDRLVRRAEQIQEGMGDGCVCADRPQVGQAGTPERPLVPPPIPVPVPSVRPETPPVVPQPLRPFVFDNFPAEIRDIIYEFYFADARPLLNEIASVRVRQDQAGSETRIRRYIRSVPRERRRFILDPRYQERTPLQWGSIPNVLRERQAFTYELHAGNDALAELGNDPLALLRVSRDVRQEASEIFLQSFRFTHPRVLESQDRAIHHGILAAESFLTDQPANVRRQIRHIELDLGAGPPLRRDPPIDVEMENNPGNSLTSPMMQSVRTGENIWTNGLDRLDILSNIMRPMEFRHMTLNFIGRPPGWWGLGVTVSEGPLYLPLKLTVQIRPFLFFLFNDSCCILKLHRTHEIHVQTGPNPSHPGLLICSI